jgi:hypothetical protein
VSRIAFLSKRGEIWIEPGWVSCLKDFLQFLAPPRVTCVTSGEICQHPQPQHPYFSTKAQLLSYWLMEVKWGIVWRLLVNYKCSACGKRDSVILPVSFLAGLLSGSFMVFSTWVMWLDFECMLGSPEFLLPSKSDNIVSERDNGEQWLRATPRERLAQTKDFVESPHPSRVSSAMRVPGNWNRPILSFGLSQREIWSPDYDLVDG